MDPELLEHYADILHKTGSSDADCQKYWKESLRILTEEQPSREYNNLEKLKQKAETGKYVE